MFQGAGSKGRTQNQGDGVQVVVQGHSGIMFDMEQGEH